MAGAPSWGLLAQRPPCSQGGCRSSNGDLRGAACWGQLPRAGFNLLGPVRVPFGGLRVPWQPGLGGGQAPHAFRAGTRIRSAPGLGSAPAGVGQRPGWPHLADRPSSLTDPGWGLAGHPASRHPCRSPRGLSGEGTLQSYAHHVERARRSKPAWKRARGEIAAECVSGPGPWAVWQAGEVGPVFPPSRSETLLPLWPTVGRVPDVRAPCPILSSVSGAASVGFLPGLGFGDVVAKD